MDVVVYAALGAKGGEHDLAYKLLAAALERRYPDMSVRRLGMDLLLTPIRRETTR